jgi:hypothetical protein
VSEDGLHFVDARKQKERNQGAKENIQFQ